MMAPTPAPVPGTVGQIGSEGPSFLMTPRKNTIVSTKGLLNMPGQNNCFLNSAVQVLWHLDAFRKNFRDLSEHSCMAESCIFCALKELFTQFQYSHESALPPDALRHALAKTFCDQRRFQLGFMDDAAECFENILLRIHVHIANQESEDLCGNVHCIPHQKFAMTLVEQRICHNCSAASEPLPFTQMVHYVTTSALCTKSLEIQKLDPNSSVSNSFGKLLRLAGEMGEVRECSGGCGEKVQAKKTLMNHPDVVSVGLVWDSESPTLQHITDVFHSIGMYLQLQEMFHNVYDTEWSNTTIYQLVGVVTYYGKHYSTFFFHTKLRVWIYFDDATVQEVGPSWDQVVEKCQRGRFQPLLLLYANPNSSPSIPNKDYSASQPCDTMSKQTLGNQRQAVINQYLMLQNYQKMGNLKSYVDMRNSDYYSNYVNDPYLYNTHRLDQGPVPHSPGYSVNSSAFFNHEQPAWKPQTPPMYSNLQYLNSLPKNPDHSELSLANNVALAPVPQMPLMDMRAIPSSPDFQKSYVGVNGYEYQLQNKNKADFDAAKDSDSAFTEEDQEVSDLYISRKAVENVLKQQKRQMSLCRSYSQSSVGNRNSSSSLESFDNVHSSNKVTTMQNLPAENVPNQRDSGSWCSDRNSSSSNNSVENPFLAVVTSKRLLLGLNKKSNVPDSNTSDHGYDSFSVSSSDSYPSVNGSPIKIEPRLTQIPEDWQPEETDLDHKLKLITEDTQGPPDCDKLCAEADLLLAKSHEKEKDGDLVMAALLSDSAAARARAAMEAPYNNSRSLVSAKLKHSTCVMRSSNLYRRIKDHEVDERRKQKGHTGHHSRQSSRDSTHSKHSRQGSKDSTHAKTTESKDSNPNSDEADHFGKNIEIYGTLPKKGSRKKNMSTGSLKVKDDQVYKDFLDKQRKNTSLSTSLNETLQKNVDPPKKRDDFSPKRKIQTNLEKSKGESVTPKSPTRKKDSPPKPEVESKKRFQKQQAAHTKSNADDRRNGVEFSCRDLLSPIPTADKKPHKIKRKLMGGFMKRKNRSLPDLREDQASTDPMDCFLDDAIIQVPSVILPNGKTKKIDDSGLGNVTRGFHQPHHAFVKKDLTQRPLLVKVNPPSIHTAVLNHKTKLVHTLPVLPSKYPEMNKLELSPTKPSKIPFMSNLPKSESNLPPIPPLRTSETKLTTATARSGLPQKISAIPVLTHQVSLSPIKPSNVPKEEPEPVQAVQEQCSDKDDLPPPTNPFLAELQAKRKQLLEKSDPKPLENKKLESLSNGMKEFSMLPKLALHGDGTSWLKELQSKQQMLLNKQDGELSKPVIAHEKPVISNEFKGTKNVSSMGSNKVNTINWKLHSENPSEVVSQPSVVPHAAGKNSNSVKDLASRFEKVLMLPKDAASMPTSPSGSSEEQMVFQANNAGLADSCVVKEAPDNITPKSTQVKFNLTPESFPPPPPPCATVSMPLKSALKTRCDPNREPLHTGSPKNVMVESSGKVIKSALKQSLPPSPTALQAPALPGSPNGPLPRPMQPPDYATAMQRLEIIRTNDSFPQEVVPPEAPKKTKKTVTFSDEVVLVACAEYDEIDFSSNPLFERVYQQHVESGKGEISILSGTYGNSHSPEKSNICDTVNQTDVNPNVPLSCNLCHNKPVTAPNSYCTDCEFYLSRFKL